jgi:DNA-binding GntR family transcriptional regulator
MAGPDARSRPDSLSRQAYLTLREGIIRGDYPQGTRLLEQRLADELSVSRVPLREAVPLLEIDGFVRTLPRRGAEVTTWTEKSAQELFDLRLCLEVGAAGYAARAVAAGAGTAQLDDALRRAHVGLDSGDDYRIAQESVWFHEVIVDMTDNALMRSIMRSVSGRMMWLFFMTSSLDQADAYSGHEEIADAIRSGHERFAESIAYGHIERHRDDSIRMLRERDYLSEPDPPGTAARAGRIDPEGPV